MEHKDHQHKDLGVLWEGQEPRQGMDLQVILACHDWPRLPRPSVSFQGQLQGQGLSYWPTRQAATAVTPTSTLKIEGYLFASPVIKTWVGVGHWEDRSSQEWDFKLNKVLCSIVCLQSQWVQSSRPACTTTCLRIQRKMISSSPEERLGSWVALETGTYCPSWTCGCQCVVPHGRAHSQPAARASSTKAELEDSIQLTQQQSSS